MTSHELKRLAPIHPGAVLEDLLREAALTPNALALALRVHRTASARSSKGSVASLPILH